VRMASLGRREAGGGESGLEGLRAVVRQEAASLALWV
jgi:hypothetical protein